MSLKNQDETIKGKIRKAFSLSEDSASHEEIKERLVDGGQVTGTNMCVLVCAMVIASVGLNVSSTAVIIGAMLISPIMGSILASAYGNVSADYHLFQNHMLGFGIQIAISVAAATIYFLLVIPGVAIATALMPPLCTCGFSIANGRWDMLLGAGYLFIINAYFIFLAASIILSILKIPKTKELSEKEWRIHRLRMVRNTIIIALPSIVALYYMVC